MVGIFVSLMFVLYIFLLVGYLLSFKMTCNEKDKTLLMIIGFVVFGLPIVENFILLLNGGVIK